jgi:hypothetical protein
VSNAKRQLKKLIEEMRHKALISEADDPAAEDAQPVDGNDSLDVQVDSYIASYEKEASNAVKEGKDFRALTRRLMTEADDEEKDADAGEDAADDAAPPQPAKKTGADLEVRTFASSVARLIENVDSLIEFRSTIMRRASNFLTKNYDAQVLRQFEIIMEDEHGIAAGKSAKDIEDDFQAPWAAQSGPGGG